MGGPRPGGAVRPPFPLEPVLVSGSLGGPGGGFVGGRLPCFLADQVGQAGDLAQPANPVLQIVPEADAQLAAGLFQAGERVSAATACGAPRAAADLATLDKLPDVRL